ncbi:MAG: sugar ABC transporter permease YjfF [Lachnospiraceae bacterium]|jgi:simple sugar transport system permease protein|nr:sugar ABC transporter permease YjfF [Lachnospiraceae bacterium]
MNETKAKAPKKGLGARILGLSDSNMLLLITIVVFVLMYIFAMTVLGKGFLTGQGFLNILNNNAYLIILACGLSIVMITGGIDISVGGVTGLITMCCAVWLDKRGGSLMGSMLLAVAIGLMFGIVQGYLVAYLDIQPFIVTLAGMFFARGLTTIINTDPFNVTQKDFVALKDTAIVIPGLGSLNRRGVYVDATIEVGVIVAIVVVILLFFLLKFTKLGRAFYAVGGNRQSALMLGINVKRTRFYAQVLCGLLAGIGGYVYFTHVGSGSVLNASGAEMNAIASSIIGGTMLTGGVGNIIGTFFGVISLGTIKDIVTSAGFEQSWWTGITVAAMLCFFIVIQSVIIKVKTRNKKK